jgi:hypothetical protein
MQVGRLNAAHGGSLSVFPVVGQVLVGFHYLINLAWWCISVRFSFADPVTHQWSVVGGGWVPRNVVDDELSVLSVDWVKVHSHRG